MPRTRLFWTLLLLLVLGIAACSNTKPDSEDLPTLTIAAYSAVRDAFERGVIPAFEAEHAARTGKRLRVRASYLASGAQSRAVAAGFPADVVALALAPDIDRIRKAGLIKQDLAKEPHRGVFTTSLVALAVRPGNPKSIANYADLARPGLEVLMPNPKTSGGAMWNVSALWAAALAGQAGVPANDPAAASRYLRSVLANVAIMDKGARESIVTFEKGIGDVAVTYESEVFAGRAAGRMYDLVIPPSTLVVEAVAAVVEVNADKHGLRAEAQAFVDYLRSDGGQNILVKYGFRSEKPEVAAQHRATFQEAVSPVRIDVLGGWSKVVPEMFGEAGVFPRAWAEIYAKD